jgi:hypothetical protein
MFMKYILCIATFLILGTTQVLAQSEEWMIPPEERGGLVIPGEYDDVPMLHHNSPQTHWYESECCSGQDCRPYRKSEYEKVPGGYRVWYLPTKPIFVPETMVRNRPRHAQPDEYMHFCISPDFPEVGIEQVPICAYRESLLF